MSRASAFFARLEAIGTIRHDAEQIIALSRLLMVVAASAAVRVDPALSSHRSLVRMLALYALASAALALAHWHGTPTARRVLVWGGLVTDAVLPAGIVMLSGDMASPLFSLCGFSVAVTATRWRAIGSLLIAIAMIVAISAAGALGLFDPDASTALWTSSSAMMRAGSLLMIALVLGQLGAGLAQRRQKLSDVSSARRASVHDLRALLAEDLNAALVAFDAERTALVFEDPDEPFVIMAEYANGTLSLTHESPEPYRRTVASALVNHDFIVDDATSDAPLVETARTTALSPPVPAPISPALVGRLGLRRVLTAHVRGDVINGRLFIESPRPPVLDDLPLAHSGLAARGAPGCAHAVAPAARVGNRL